MAAVVVMNKLSTPILETGVGQTCAAVRAVRNLDYCFPDYIVKTFKMVVLFQVIARCLAADEQAAAGAQSASSVK